MKGLKEEIGEIQDKIEKMDEKMLLITNKIERDEKFIILYNEHFKHIAYFELIKVYILL